MASVCLMMVSIDRLLALHMPLIYFRHQLRTQVVQVEFEFSLSYL